MITVIIQLKVKDPADVESIRGLLAEQGRLSRAEPGCLRFEVYQSQNDPATFFLCEHWDTQASLDEHRKAKAYTTIYAPQVLPKVDRVPHPSTIVE